MRRRKGLSLLELLVALAASLVLVAGVSSAFILVIRSSDEAEATVRAHASARSAVDMIGRDLRQLQLDADPAYHELIVEDVTLAYGNYIDDDNDGVIDEEIFDARDDTADNDSDWTVANDRHATIGAFTERANAVGFPDYGDEKVDEDNRFSADRITFIIPAGISGPGSPRQRVTYRLGTFDGEENVLLREVTDNPLPASVDPVVTEPIVFDVVSLDILPWNSNSDFDNSPNGLPYWQKTWDTSAIDLINVTPFSAPFGVPPFKLPTSFLIAVTVNAERVPLSEITGWPLAGTPIKTVTIDTVVNVESIVQDPRYDQYVRD